ncbi:thiol-disulfide oxidoreductase DCC family protein [Parachitinimonas caeni]|uniref:DUF393 domain-containing protein n=1 Tax=Parachitinimonas caeni TaxID=3031301 RepID=A0ABT7DZM7_9NEIS|nr:DUF393 domain-containing protein [Parachitinimonas caeni]MDK2124107.1 DUF393 domain-containing protein [Parachitinimonas caeni]
MQTYPLMLFYDGACPLCVTEMTRLHQRDRAGHLQMVDIARPDFQPERYGASLDAMRTELHGLTADGRLLVGIDAIYASYAAVGWGWLAAPLKISPLKPFWRRAYRWLARNRYRASQVLGYRCTEGVCSARFK